MSDAEGGMTWTHGKKPRVTATAARNPDGGWRLAFSNFTVAEFRDGTTRKWEIDQGGYSARSF